MYYRSKSGSMGRNEIKHKFYFMGEVGEFYVWSNLSEK